MTSPNSGFDVFAVVESEGVELFDPNERFEMRSEALSMMSNKEFKRGDVPALSIMRSVEFKKGDTSMTNPTNVGLTRSPSSTSKNTSSVNPALIKTQLSNIQEKKEEELFDKEEKDEKATSSFITIETQKQKNVGHFQLHETDD